MNISLAVGIIFLAGAAGGKLARYVKLPSVTGNLLAGILVGPSVLGLVSLGVMKELTPINELALGVIALSIGAELHWGTMRKLAKDAAKVFLVEALLTLIVVFGSLYLFGLPFRYALIFGVISIATAPGAIIACIRETPTKGDFAKVLLSVVALDNLFAITLFGIIISFMEVGLAAAEAANTPAIVMASRDIGISLLLGISTGVFLVITSHKAKSDTRILVSALGAVLITVGLSNQWGTPALLAAITAGAVYINFSRSPQRISRSLMNVEDPILLVFLTLAGAKLDLSVLPSVGLIGLVYIGARFFAKLVGSRVGTTLTHFPISWKRNLGRALTPQAGVAIGLAIIAEQKTIFAPDTIMPVVLTAVVVFELIGPILVRKALCDVDSV
ncbi:cation:proton antiporter [Alkaliphilus peptidifermentans]|uniref:Transporter, CPA2 family n=1 Tax=Alkaliphilus peptidifermentans DSM 18978 TaxID=1120976 RepID=A0A1G5C1U9_9FIRM|nr:cation:proton antiporter [Alkaliphilus peptidifermentans]SCX96254.1 transporter, CPA2 family [Alkaliphilus peptidifermentans DSM 18978]